MTFDRHQSNVFLPYQYNNFLYVLFKKRQCKRHDFRKKMTEKNSILPMGLSFHIRSARLLKKHFISLNIHHKILILHVSNYQFINSELLANMFMWKRKTGVIF